MLKVSKDLSLPLDLAGEATAILAKRGAGKTNTATVFAEELIREGVQTVILDPVGAWWGIRYGSDGESPGLQVPVLGGAHGDVPLEQTAGALIADVAVDSGQSLLLDLSDLPSKAAVGRFVTDFAERLFRRKARDHSLLHLILEEADSFAPQKVKGSERMQGAIEQIVRRGRARGLGATLITQRSAVLSKDVLTQADTLVVMRTTGPHDLRAVKEWIDSRGDERGAGVMDSLPSLATGEGWIWNPENDVLSRVQFRARKTFDSSRTPKAGEHRAEPENAASIDIAALGEKIKATAERVKAEDPRELKTRIRELESELAHKNDVTVVTETVEVPVFNGEIENLETLMRQLKLRVDDVAEFQHTIHDSYESLVARIAELKGVSNVRSDTRAGRTAARDRSAARPDRGRAERHAHRPRHRSEDAQAAEGFEPTVPQQKVLDALAWLESIELEGERRRVGFIAGYSPNSGNFNNLLGQLRTASIVDYPKVGTVELTDAGRALAQAPEETPTTSALHAKVLEKLPGPQRRVLEALLARYPHDASKQEIADEVGYSANSGNFNNILGKMRTLGIIEYPAPGYVRAEDVLFLE